MDDLYDLGEAMWRRRFSRRLAEARGLERARARAEALATRAELATARGETPAGGSASAEACRVGPRGVRVTAARLAQLAKVRVCGGRNSWRGVDAPTRRTIMAQRVRCRWARASSEERRAVAIALNHARWHRLDLAKLAPGGGVYK